MPIALPANPPSHLEIVVALAFGVAILLTLLIVVGSRYLAEPKRVSLETMNERYAPRVFKWLLTSEWDSNICDELTPVIAWLRTRGIVIIAMGFENQWTPNLVIFVSEPLPFQDLSAQFERTNEQLLLRDGFIGCKKHYFGVVFEGNPVDNCRPLSSN